MPKLNIEDYTGKRADVDVSLADYQAAGDANVSLSQYYTTRFPTKEGEATAFEQMCVQSGIRVRADKKTGIPATSMKEILDDRPNKYAGVITRPDGSDRGGTAGRLLYPEVMLQLIQANLHENKEDYLAPWESAIALKTTVSSPRVDQPTIDVTAPEDSKAQPIGQLAEPAVMVSITLGERAYTIPTKSIGLQIADQALEAATIDLVGLTLAAQARGERIRRIEEDMGNIINGDGDYGINAVDFVDASTFDPGIPGVPMTQRAWVKWLRANYLKMNITHILADIDSVLDIEGRTGRPTVFNDTSDQANLLDAKYTVENMGLPTPKVLLLPTSIIGANSVVGFDAQYALQEITNVSASYQAIEQFVLRRATAMRFDYGSALFKLFDEAFTGVTIGS